ncbi:MAG TPA: hypothetical protein VMP08_23495 [Anaerolineae bacterium]|nr:hypothetical protein [Anaerolineae bacterium]
MTRTTKILGLTVLVLAIAALGVSSVFAQTTTPPAQTAPQMRGGFGRGAVCGQAGLDAAAKALNMTSTDLKAQLWGGQTLSGLADKAGVKITDVQAAVQAACQQAQIDAINQAVKNGKITQANADWLIEGIQKGYIGGGKAFFGMGFGFGMMGRFGRGGFGHGFGMPKGTAPSTTPNSSTSPSRYVF